MKEKVTPYLTNLFDQSLAVSAQYVKSELEKLDQQSFMEDPLGEDEHEVVKGLVHKYTNRALIKVSLKCAAHCRFCTRYRQIGLNEGDLGLEDVRNIADYVESHKEINDVILSGGDPLYAPKTTIELLGMLREVESIKVFRVGTRLPIHSPQSFDTPLLHRAIDLVNDIGKDRPFFILLNFQHPDELTHETLGVVGMLRRKNVILLSQTVFLNGVNNSTEILYKLFEGLYHSGVIPYYLYRCDYVKGVERFVCDIEQERRIMTELRSTLSGIACPNYVVDLPGHGKVPVPLNYWDGVDVSRARDFKGQEVLI